MNTHLQQYKVRQFYMYTLTKLQSQENVHVCLYKITRSRKFTCLLELWTSMLIDVARI